MSSARMIRMLGLGAAAQHIVARDVSKTAMRTAKPARRMGLAMEFIHVTQIHSEVPAPRAFGPGGERPGGDEGSASCWVAGAPRGHRNRRAQSHLGCPLQTRR